MKKVSMAVIPIANSPRITDTAQIDFITTDENDNVLNPYRVDNVTIYFIERDFTSHNYSSLTEDVNGVLTTMFYTNALPVYSVGNELLPAWNSTDTANALITKRAFDDDGNTLIGNFRVLWSPQQTREGDYIVCYTWTPFPASKKLSASQGFFILGNTAATTAIPTHFTVSGKYEKLFDNYLPEMFKTTLSDTDVTPDVLSRFNDAVAKGFTTIEDLANQLIDLLDANACNEAFLPYLANFFQIKLRSNDPTLWRRQIKTAIPHYKKKGTLSGLQEALASIGATFKKFTQYWQVVSKSTWQEGFVVTEDHQTSFSLTKLALLPVDPSNYELSIRYYGTTSYVSLSLDYVTFSTVNDITQMTWIPTGVIGNTIDLANGDVVRIIYKTSQINDQALEDYIRALPLADKRDETVVTNPQKNWNVRLLAQDDVMFDVIISQLHPFHYPAVWGKIRTEFAYSENIYNMEEWNGSFRDSDNPCDIDKSFIDACSDCIGSVIAVDVEIENLTDDRIAEVLEVINENKPFHAQIDSINYSGSIDEFVLTPIEDLEILIFWSMNENIFIGQGDWTRNIPILNTEEIGQLKRDMLSTTSTAVSSTAGTAFNNEIVLFSPDHQFNRLDDVNFIDADNPTKTLLEILDGANAGKYNVTDPGTNTLKIIQGSPDTVPYPLDTAAFTFNLSNEIVEDLSATIFQDDIYNFTESGQDFIALNLLTESNSAVPSKLVVTSGAYSGIYIIHELLPDNSLLVNGFPATSNVTSLRYNITTNTGTILLNRSINGVGVLAVTRRGRVSTVNLTTDWDIRIGYIIRYNNVDYKISGFKDASNAYIVNYTSGTVAGVSIRVYKRLIDQGTGYVDARGMYLLTAIDYESGLDVQNGSNPPATPLENNSFKENFLVVIDSNYYQITGWNANRLDLAGPKEVWGLAGTAVTFSIIQFVNVPTTFAQQDFQRLDRRGNEAATAATTTVPMYQTMHFAALNAGSGGEIIDQIKVDESISFQIEWQDGSYTEGQI